MLHRLHQLYHTIKHLRFEQIVYRIWYKLRPSIHLTPTPSTLNIAPVNKWGEGDFSLTGKPSFLSETKVSFLNEIGSIATPADWNNPKKTKLWLYNLHYFDDLNAKDSQSRHALHLTLIHRWIAENPLMHGVGWEPYTLSLRLVNWIKWISCFKIHDPKIIKSIALQAQALSKQLEYHILGNHLFANGKALVFVGCFIAGPDAQKYFKTGLQILKREITEQFLTDGAHFELSPMYHSILLWDMLDLYQLAAISQKPELVELCPQWETIIRKGIDWLTVMTHPDGEVSFFNDSAMGIAPKLGEILTYATVLGITPNRESETFETDPPMHNPQNRIKTLLPSGYTRITTEAYSLIFDHGAVGPDYQPGHAHADTLSIEWSVGTERVLVNSGTSTYESTPERLRQRKTAAHNTVVVNGQASSEVWSSFRVAQRAYSKLLDIREKDKVSIIASHDGYKRLKQPMIHQRKVSGNVNSICIHDTVIPLYKIGVSEAIAYYHLHPAITIMINSNTSLLLTLANGKKIQVSADTDITVEASTWHPRFGESIPNQRLCIPLDNAKSCVKFKIENI